MRTQAASGQSLSPVAAESAPAPAAEWQSWDWEPSLVTICNKLRSESGDWSDEPGPTESRQQRAQSGVSGEWSVQRITLQIMISRAGPGPALSTDWPHCYQY